MATFRNNNGNKLKELNIQSYLEEANPLEGKPYAASPTKVHKIAIIGMAGKAGPAENLEELWRLLVDGGEGIRVLPEGRRQEVDNYLSFRGVDLTSKDFNYLRASYLTDIAGFDYKFFGLSYREAIYMDPNQRMFLETAWKALEDAGYGGISIKGTDTGVFVGYSSDFGEDYRRLVAYSANASPEVAVSGNIKSIIASRLTYQLDLHGPAILMDTACSSGLTAMYKAVQAIRDGECTMAIAGAVASFPVPVEENGEMGIGIKDIKNITAMDAHTRTFDNSCDGTYVAEGVFAYVLKSLEQAEADGDNIYAVIMGGAINQDGASNGITSPNSEAQKQLIQKALQDSQINIEDISYIEAHGTATKLGDPIEIEGITQAFRQLTNKKQFCAISSLKSNLGHLDCASGLGGIAKIILSMKHGILPASINFNIPNRNINFIESPVYVNNTTRPWQVNDKGPLYAGINSFGISGTNCHLILGSAPEPIDAVEIQHISTYLLPLSARTMEALRELAGDYLTQLRRNNMNLADVMYTASVGRMHFEARVAIIFQNKDELCLLLEGFLGNHTLPEAASKIRYGLHRMIDSEQKRRFDYDITQSEMNRVGAEAFRLLHDSKNTPWEELIQYYAKYYVLGVELPWEELFHGRKGKRISLPTYPFQHTSCWISYPIGNKKIDHKRNMLLGDKKYAAIGHTMYCSPMNTEDCWELYDHRVQGSCVLPGTALIQRMIAYVRQNNTDYPLHYKNITFHTPLSVKAGQRTELHLLVEEEEERLIYKFASSDDNREWRLHGEGEFSKIPYSGKKDREKISINKLKSGMPNQAVLNDEGDSQRGIVLGGRWSNLISGAWSNQTNDEFLIQVILPEQYRADISDYCFHTSLADVAVNAANNAANAELLYLPLHYDELIVYQQLPDMFYSYIKRNSQDTNSPIQSFDITIYDLEGNCIVQIKNYSIKSTTEYVSNKDAGPYGARQSYQLYEAPIPFEKTIGKILVAGRISSHTKKLLDQLKHKGGKVLQITRDNMGWEAELKSIASEHIELAIFEWAPAKDTSDEYEYWNSETDEAVIQGFEFIISWHKLKLKATKGLVAITDRSMSVDGSEEMIHPSQAALAGLWSVAGLEFEFSNMRVVEHDRSISSELLMNELYSTPRPNYIVYRQGKPYIKVIESLPLEFGAEAFPLDNSGVYVISGGTGDLGLHVAELLSQKGAGSIVLLGKGYLPARDRWSSYLQTSDDSRLRSKLVKLIELDKKIPNLVVENIPIEEYEAVNALFIRIRAELGPVKGILHLAGIAGDGYLISKKLQTFQSVYNTKAKGAVNLHLVSLKDKLDFFIQFSSVSSLLHYPGQSDYTSANMFLDSLSEYRLLRGQVSISIQWPAWRQTGIAFRMGAVDEKELFTPVDTQEAISLLEGILNNLKDIRPVIMPGILKMADKHEAITKNSQIHSDDTKESTGLLLLGIEEVDEIYKSVGHIWAKTLGLQEIDIDDEFHGLGGNSLLISQMLRLYQERFPQVMNIIDLFTYNTIRKQVAYIKKEKGISEVQQDINQGDDNKPNSSDYIESILKSVLDGELSIDESYTLLNSQTN